MWNYEQLSNPRVENGVLTLTVHWECTPQPIQFIGGDLSVIRSVMNDGDAATLQGILDSDPHLQEVFNVSRTNAEEDQEAGDQD